MIKPTLAVVAIVAIAAMMGAASVAPVYAAAKTVVDEKQDINDTLPGTEFICGTNVTVERELIYHLTIWENGHFELQSSIIKKYIGVNTNEQVGLSTDKLNLNDTMDGDIIMIKNVKIICTNGEPNEITKSGLTITTSGNIIFS